MLFMLKKTQQQSDEKKKKIKTDPGLLSGRYGSTASTNSEGCKITSCVSCSQLTTTFEGLL